jgi:hypothetical protein
MIPNPNPFDLMNTPTNTPPRRPRPAGLPGEPPRFPPHRNADAERPSPLPAGREHPLEDLKRQLLRETLAVTEDPALVAPIRRAANEAAALASLEPLPLLVFPELFAEKGRTAEGQVRLQRDVRARTARLTAVLA